MVTKIHVFRNPLIVLNARSLFWCARHFSSKSTNPPPVYWDYSTSYGPSQWENKWKTGKRQSPIDLCTKSAKYDSSLGPFALDKQPVKFNAKNIGNNVSMTTDHPDPLLVKGGPLEAVYRFAEMHMHWGEVNVCGCEHTIDGKRFAGEIHLVHWNIGYGEMPQALDKSDGLAVLGVLLDAQKEHVCHPSLDLLLDMFDRVHQEGNSTTSTHNFSPYSMLPSHNAYFTYPGSLTTPPLFESVTWTVFMQSMAISHKQWERLNSVTTSKGHNGADRFCRSCGTPSSDEHVISNNYRPVQELHQRVVRSSVQL